MIHIGIVRLTKFAVKALVTHGGLIGIVKMNSTDGNRGTGMVYMMGRVMVNTLVQG